MTWTDHQSATAPYTIDATYMSRVKQVVDWALADGLYVVINVHHDSRQWISKMPADHDNVLARFNATWTQISSTFRDEPRTLLFESVNEPEFDNATDAQKTQLLNELILVEGGVRPLLGRREHRPPARPAHAVLQARPEPHGRPVHHDQRAARQQSGRHRALLQLVPVQREHRGRHPV